MLASCWGSVQCGQPNKPIVRKPYEWSSETRFVRISYDFRRRNTESWILCWVPTGCISLIGNGRCANLLCPSPGAAGGAYTVPRVFPRKRRFRQSLNPRPSGRRNGPPRGDRRIVVLPAAQGGWLKGKRQIARRQIAPPFPTPGFPRLRQAPHRHATAPLAIITHQDSEYHLTGEDFVAALHRLATSGTTASPSSRMGAMS